MSLQENHKDTILQYIQCHVVPSDNGCYEWTGNYSVYEKDGKEYFYPNLFGCGVPLKYVDHKQVRRWILDHLLNREVYRHQKIYMTCRNDQCVNPDHIDSGTRFYTIGKAAMAHRRQVAEDKKYFADIKERFSKHQDQRSISTGFTGTYSISRLNSR